MSLNISHTHTDASNHHTVIQNSVPTVVYAPIPTTSRDIIDAVAVNGSGTRVRSAVLGPDEKHDDHKIIASPSTTTAHLAVEQDNYSHNERIHHERRSNNERTTHSERCAMHVFTFDKSTFKAIAHVDGACTHIVFGWIRCAARA